MIPRLLDDNVIQCLSNKWRYSYYRTTAQAELDLVLEGPGKAVFAVEIKRSVAPRATRGFHLASEDIGATRKFVVYSGQETFPLAHDTEAISLDAFLAEIYQAA
jgi:predicted AAA+ superfamily ATPase